MRFRNRQRVPPAVPGPQVVAAPITLAVLRPLCTSALGDLASWRTAPAFSVTLPADNFFAPLPAGTYGPTVADGVYLLLAPLTPGAHTITFGGTGSFAGGKFMEDITYHLVVALGA